MSDLGKTIANLLKDADDMKSQFGAAGSVGYYLSTMNESIEPEDRYVIIKTRGLGSSFVFGHSQLGVFGEGLTPQPYFGDSRPGWTIQRITQNNNTYKEWMKTTTFLSGGDAVWQTASGCIYF